MDSITIDIDSALFIAFLVFNLAFGIYHAVGIKDLKEYAVGNKDFSTATIVATIVATMTQGDTLFVIISETYSSGLYFIASAILGDFLRFLLYGFFFAPRFGEFLGAISIGEIMGNLYGQKVRVITAIAGSLGTAGLVALQLKVAGLLFQYSFDLQELYGIIISGVIIVIYSSLGGVKSVTFTDVLQLFTFGTILPTIAFLILNSLDNVDVIVNTLKHHELYDYTKVFDFTDPKAFSFLLLFIFFAIPAFGPSSVQRMLMAKNTQQIKRSFVLSGVTCLVINLVMVFLGVIVFSTEPNLDTSKVVQHVLYNYSYAGLKGLTLICVMAMIMSTADSEINATAVLVVNDFINVVKEEKIKDSLNASRICAAIVGGISIVLSVYGGDSILDLLILTFSFYTPIITVPLVIAILGFRTTGKPVMAGMLAGFLTFVTFKFWLQQDALNALVPAILANTFFLFAGHYVLRQEGGWVGIKDQESLNIARRERAKKWHNFIQGIKEFSFLKAFLENYPKREGSYIALGFFCIISMYITNYTLPKEIKAMYPELLKFIPTTVLFCSTAILSYPLWPDGLKRKKTALAVIWNIIIFYMLVVVGFLFVIMSNFSQQQLMIFMINVIMISMISRWQISLFMIVTGVILSSTIFYKIYNHINNLGTLEFQIIYLLLMIMGCLVAFVKPKQDEFDDNESNLLYALKQNKILDEAAIRAMSMGQRILDNFSHEMRSSIGNVAGLSSLLLDLFANTLPEKVKTSLQYIDKDARRLSKMIVEMTTINEINRDQLVLSLDTVNMTELLQERIDSIKKFYVPDVLYQSPEIMKELEDIQSNLNNLRPEQLGLLAMTTQTLTNHYRDVKFEVSLEPNVIFQCDRELMINAIGNVIDNAVKFTAKGTVKISLASDYNYVTIIVEDEGPGVPPDELITIFDPFIIATNTQANTGGRGIGLTLSSKVIEAHKGKIKAKRKEPIGMIFTITLPR